MFETHEDRRERLDREERENHRRWRRRSRFTSGYGPGVVLVGVFVMAAVGGMYAMSVEVRLHAVRSELVDTLDGLRVAQLSYEMANGRYLSVGDPGAAYDALEAGRVYPPATDLGWRPDGRGVYWVVAGDKGFEAHGMLDADGDGFPAHWVATETRPPYALTDEGVF